MSDEEKIKKANLTPEEFHITQEKGTEAPFQNKYWNNNDDGMYYCRVCGELLFSSERKYDSGSGWPSFDAPVSKENVERRVDMSEGMTREEVLCKKCGAHLGHVFADGPKITTSERFCINSASLFFEKEKSNKENL